MSLLKKNVAVMVTAAILACSLVACGGGGSVPNPGTSNGVSSGATNNPSAGTGSNTTDDSNQKPDSSPKDDSTLGGSDATKPEKPDTVKKTTWKASRTGQYFGTGKMYYKRQGTFYGQPAIVESAGDTKSGDQYVGYTINGTKVMAVLIDWDANKEYMIYYPGIENVPGVAALPEYLKGKTFYTEEDIEEDIEKARLPKDNAEVEIGEYEYPKDSGIKYYAEKVQNLIYGYDSMSGKIKLVVSIDSKTGKESIKCYDEVLNDFPDSLMKLPEGAIKLDQDEESENKAG